MKQIKFTAMIAIILYFIIGCSSHLRTTPIVRLKADTIKKVVLLKPVDTVHGVVITQDNQQQFQRNMNDLYLRSIKTYGKIDGLTPLLQKVLEQNVMRTQISRELRISNDSLSNRIEQLNFSQARLIKAVIDKSVSEERYRKESANFNSNIDKVSLICPILAILINLYVLYKLKKIKQEFQLIW